MRLMEEPVRQQSIGVSFTAAIAAKQNERDELEKLTKQFLRRGGRIEAAPIFKKPDDEIPRTYGGYESIEKKRMTKAALSRTNGNRISSSGRQNITQKSPRHMYQVTINKVYLGSFKTEQEAVTVRDEYRKRNGMPSADY